MTTVKNSRTRSPIEEETTSTNKSQLGNNVSHISNPLNDDENLIKTKISSDALTSRGDSPPRPLRKDHKHTDSSNNVKIEIGKYQRPTFRHNAALFLTSKCMDWFFLGLIIIYMGIVVADLIIDNGCITAYGVILALQILRYVEISILSLFILEIVFKSAAMGIKGYFKDCWYMVDAVIILITFGLVIVDICTQGQVAGLSQLRGLFRLFRVFLLYRKATTFTKVARKRIQTSGINIKSPVEKVLDLLDSLKHFTKDKETLKEIAWAVEIVSTNKLYDVILDKETSDGNKEVSNFLQSYGTRVIDPEKRARRQSMVSEKRDGSASRVLPQAASSLPKEVLTVLDASALQFTFDVFNFSKIIPKHELSSLMHYLFDKFNIFETVDISSSVFMRFAQKIHDGYRDNPYHNVLHATDVLQTVAYLTVTCGFKDSADLDETDLASMFIAAAIHDYDHPGYNNVYHVNSQHDLAIRYNDKAVLENYHVAATYMILKDKDYNIFSDMGKGEFKSVREKIIAMVLATDMSQHFSELALLKSRLAADFDKKSKDKLLCMKMILHSADISNPAKPWNVCETWAIRCLDEFWAQGDVEREKGLPISYLCDRYTTNTSKSQVGFMDIFVQPTWEIISQFLTGVELSHFEINKSNWKSREAFYDEELKKLNEEKAEREKRDGILAGK